MGEECIWRKDIDSLAFRASGQEGFCVVHRLAFRALLGAEASPENCLAYFRAQRWAFGAAARAKADLKGLPADASFHLTSRDLRRVLEAVA